MVLEQASNPRVSCRVVNKISHLLIDKISFRPEYEGAVLIALVKATLIRLAIIRIAVRIREVLTDFILIALK